MERIGSTVVDSGVHRLGRILLDEESFPLSHARHFEAGPSFVEEVLPATRISVLFAHLCREKDIQNIYAVDYKQRRC